MGYFEKGLVWLIMKSIKCFYIGQCSFRNSDGTCIKEGCSLNDIAVVRENIKRFNPSRKDDGLLKKRKSHEIKTGVLNFSPTVWLTLYDSLLKGKFSKETKQRLRVNRQKIIDLYKEVEGEWWKRGWRIRLKMIFQSKMGYELRNELKAIDLALKDLRSLKIKIAIP